MRRQKSSIGPRIESFCIAINVSAISFVKCSSLDHSPSSYRLLRFLSQPSCLHFPFPSLSTSSRYHLHSSLSAHPLPPGTRKRKKISPIGPLLIKHTISTLLAPDDIASLENNLGIAITAEVGDGTVIVFVGGCGGETCTAGVGGVGCVGG